jgi:hypothetical protein
VSLPIDALRGDVEAGRGRVEVRAQRALCEDYMLMGVVCRLELSLAGAPWKKDPSGRMERFSRVPRRIARMHRPPFFAA